MLLGDWVLSGASIFERPADVSTDVKKGDAIHGHVNARERLLLHPAVSECCGLRRGYLVPSQH